MNTNKHGLLSEEETKQIIGCSVEVLNERGHGFIEKPYEKALVVEFHRRNIPFLQQSRYDILFKGVSVGTYIPDLVDFNTVVVDTKVIDRITDHAMGQMLSYLKTTGLNVGMIINFKRAKLEWKRVIL